MKEGVTGLIAIDENDYPNMIRIIKTPAGEAPIEVREAWVGIQLPASAPFTDAARGAVSYELQEPREVFAVPTRLALLYLLGQGKEDAAQWWHDNLPLGALIASKLYFGTDEAEISEGFGTEGLNISLDLRRFYRLDPNYPFQRPNLGEILPDEPEADGEIPF